VGFGSADFGAHTVAVEDAPGDQGQDIAAPAVVVDERIAGRLRVVGPRTVLQPIIGPVLDEY